MAIMTILLLAANSAIVVAARAVPDGRGRSSSILSAARGMDQLAADIASASSVTQMTATSVTFNVPDRNGDGSAEQIMYSWTGYPGQPLMRKFNGSSVSIVPGVTEFALAYDKRATAAATTYTESAEMLLYSYNPTTSLGDATVQSNSWFAQYFIPTLPASATSWRVTRVQLMVAKRSNAVGQTQVQLRTTSGTTPTSAVLEETALMESTLTSSYVWKDFNYTNLVTLPPSAGMCIVLKWISDTESCDTRYQTSGSTAANAVFLKSTDGGSTWTPQTGQSLLFYVYGKVKTPDPVVYTYNLRTINITLRGAGDTSARLNTSIRIQNEPLVTGP